MIEFLLYKNENNEYYPIIREPLEQSDYNNTKYGFVYKYKYYIISQDIIYKKRITKNILYTAVNLYYRYDISSPILSIRHCSSDSEFLETLGWTYYTVIYSYTISK